MEIIEKNVSVLLVPTCKLIGLRVNFRELSKCFRIISDFSFYHTSIDIRELKVKIYLNIYFIGSAHALVFIIL